MLKCEEANAGFLWALGAQPCSPQPFQGGTEPLGPEKI